MYAYEIRTEREGFFATTDDLDIARSIANLARTWYGAQTVMIWDTEAGYRVCEETGVLLDA